MMETSRAGRWLPLLSLMLILLPACGTLEVNVLPPTSSADPTATPAPETDPASPPATTGATPTPYIDHWTPTAFPHFGITLEEPVDGFRTIGLTDESALLSADGSEILLRDIPLGATVKAFGQPGTSDALIADHILVTDAQ